MWALSEEVEARRLHMIVGTPGLDLVFHCEVRHVCLAFQSSLLEIATDVE